MYMYYCNVLNKTTEHTVLTQLTELIGKQRLFVFAGTVLVQYTLCHLLYVLAQRHQKHTFRYVMLI